MKKYVSPHLRLHGRPGMDAKPAPTADKKPIDGAGPMKHDMGHEAPPTKPHPKTGVHSFHAHHVGGGHFMSHTHHSDGSIEKNEHNGEQEVHDHMMQAFPTSEGNDAQHDQNADNDEYADGGSMANMDSLGGE